MNEKTVIPFGPELDKSKTNSSEMGEQNRVLQNPYNSYGYITNSRSSDTTQSFMFGPMIANVNIF